MLNSKKKSGEQDDIFKSYEEPGLIGTMDCLVVTPEWGFLKSRFHQRYVKKKINNPSINLNKIQLQLRFLDANLADHSFNSSSGGMWMKNIPEKKYHAWRKCQ